MLPVPGGSQAGELCCPQPQSCTPHPPCFFQWLPPAILTPSGLCCSPSRLILSSSSVSNLTSAALRAGSAEPSALGSHGPLCLPPGRSWQLTTQGGKGRAPAPGPLATPHIGGQSLLQSPSCSTARLPGEPRTPRLSLHPTHSLSHPIIKVQPFTQSSSTFSPNVCSVLLPYLH